MSDTFDLGGEGGNAFSWGPVGTQPGGYVQGTVLDMKEVQSTNFQTKELEFWDNGDPKMQYRVTLQTELRDPANVADDGKRDVYLDGRRRANDNGTKSKLCATLDAVREATGGTQLQRGGKLTLQWTAGVGVTGDPRSFVAWYEAPALQLGNPGGQPPGTAPQPTAAPPVSPPQTVQQTIATQGPPPDFAQPQLPVAPPEAPPAAPPVQQAAAPVPAAQVGPPPEAIAALKAAGVDPASVYPGWVDPAAQPVG